MSSSERTLPANFSKLGLPSSVGVPLVTAPPARDCQLCVTIPARDEAESIAATIGALAGQRGLDGRPFPRARFEVILLANNCGDETAEVARQAARSAPGLVLHVVEAKLPPAAAHVGHARRMLMDEAHRRLFHVLGRPRGIIATTDADTVVAPDWLAATERELARPQGGAQAVGGNIRPCPRGLAELVNGARQLERRDTIYQLLANYYEHLLDPDPADPWPRHYHHFGGSLAVTAAAYARAGGLPPLPALEDLAFYKALRRHDIPFRHSPAVRVRTSARCFGRTPHGLSATLRRWTEISSDPDGRSAATHFVESPDALDARIRLRRRLRWLWTTRARQRDDAGWSARAARAALALGLELPAVVRELSMAPAFGAAHEQLLDAGSPLHLRMPGVEVNAAIEELRARIAGLRRGGARSVAAAAVASIAA